MNEQSDLAIDIGVAMQKLNRQLARVEADFQKAALRQERNFVKANDKIAKDFERLQQKANAELGKIRLPGLGGIGGALAGFVSTRELIRMTDTWTDLSARVGLAVGEMGRAPEIMSRISEMARRTYSSLEATAESWLANSTALRELGMSTEESLDFTEALNNALVVSGAKAQRAASVQDALAKAMALGKLSGDQLNTVIASGGRVAELLAEELGVNVNQLRQVGTQGKITGDVIDRALRGNLAKLRDEAESMPATISDGFLLMKNAVLEYVGTADESVGASARLAEALVFLADNIDLVVAAGGVLAGRVLGPAMLAMLAGLAVSLRGAAAAMLTTASAAGTATAALTGLRAALAFIGGPVGLVLAGLTALPLVTTSAAERVDRLKGASSQAVEALNAFAEASARAKKEQEELGGGVTAATDAMLTQSRVALQEARSQLQKEIRDAERDALGRGLDPTNISEVNRVRSRFLMPARGHGGVFQEIVDLMDAVENGSRSLGSVSRRLEQIAGAGDEATDAVAEFRKAVSDQRSTDQAIQNLVSLAERIGGFEDHVAKVSAAAGTSGAAGAVEELALAMEMTAAAGEVLRTNGSARSLRQNAEAANDATASLEQTENVLRGNIEAQEALRALGNPFEQTETGARRSASEIRNLTSAYQEYARSRRDGDAWANSSAGFEAQYVADRARGAGSRDEELVRAVVAVSEQLGIAAKDLLAVMSFETGGELRPDVMGPTTKWGQHFGLIQFGQPQGARYGVSPESSITEQVVAVGKYLQDAGVKAGDSLANVYAAVLAGDARKIHASDLAAGGVVGNVSAAVGGNQFAGHIARAEGLLAAYGGVVKEVADAEKDAASAAKEAAEARTDLLSQAQRQVADQQFELGLIGKSAAEQARLRAEYLLTNDAKARGIDLTEKIAGSEKTYGQAIAENAKRIGEYVAQQENQARAIQNAADRQAYLNQMQADMKNGLLDAIAEGRNFGDVLSNIARLLARAALQAALFNEGLFSSGAGRGLLGGVFDRIFGRDPLSGALRGAGLSPVGSWEGGGFTWSGARAGGIDGRGGRLGILHPNEVVTDLTKSRGGSNRVSFAPNISIAPGVTQDELAMTFAAARQEYERNFLPMLHKTMPEFNERYG